MKILNKSTFIILFEEIFLNVTPEQLSNNNFFFFLFKYQNLCSINFDD